MQRTLGIVGLKMSNLAQKPASDQYFCPRTVLLCEKPSEKGTHRYLNLGQSFQFYVLLLLISLGNLPYASICGPGRFNKGLLAMPGDRYSSMYGIQVELFYQYHFYSTD